MNHDLIIEYFSKLREKFNVLAQICFLNHVLFNVIWNKPEFFVYGIQREYLFAFYGSFIFLTPLINMYLEKKEFSNPSINESRD